MTIPYIIFFSTSEIAALELNYFDVGQENAVLIQCESSTMLIDAGANESTSSLLDYFSSRNIKKFDILVGTHPHEDHIGGMDAVVTSFDIGTILMPKIAHDTLTFEDVLTAISEKGLTITAPKVGNTYQLGDAIITILSPISDKYPELNNYSIVIRIDYGDRSFIFPGDAEAYNENEMLLNDSPLDADVLMIGIMAAHHLQHLPLVKQCPHSMQL